MATALAISTFASATVAILGLFAFFGVGFRGSSSALVPRRLLLSVLSFLLLAALLGLLP